MPVALELAVTGLVTCDTMEGQTQVLCVCGGMAGTAESRWAHPHPARTDRVREHFPRRVFQKQAPASSSTVLTQTQLLTPQVPESQQSLLGVLPLSAFPVFCPPLQPEEARTAKSGPTTLPQSHPLPAKS